MTPAETADALREFNRWRRGDDNLPQPDTHQLGLTIDAAVELIERMSAIEEAAKNLVKVKGRHHSEIAYKRLVDALEKQNAQRHQ